jgi:hypothetical protein
MEYFIFIIMLGFASIVVLLFFSVISKNILIFSTLSLTVLLAIAIGFSLETGESNTSKKFQLGIKDRYIEQCMRPLSATTANIALLKERMRLLNIPIENLLLGITKEKQEELNLEVDAGYYWIYYRSCKNLKETKVINSFLKKYDN